MAPLALPMVDPAPVEPEPETPAESPDPSVSGELLPASEPLVEPEAESVDEAPLLLETPEEPADAIALDPVDEEPRPDVDGAEPPVHPTS